MPAPDQKELSASEKALTYIKHYRRRAAEREADIMGLLEAWLNAELADGRLTVPPNNYCHGSAKALTITAGGRLSEACIGKIRARASRRGYEVDESDGEIVITNGEIHAFEYAMTHSS